MKTDVPYSLEQVDGLNVAEGLERVMGDRNLYQEVLIEFCDNYRNTAQILRDLIGAKLWDKAEALAHSIKGTSGMLSADALFAASVELDAILKVAKCAGVCSPGLPAAIDRFQVELERLAKGVDRLAGKHSASP